jgi:MFS family permease
VITAALPGRPEARRLLVGTFLSSIGQGMTLPFLFVYLTEVRHLDPTIVGVLVAWMGLLGLVLSAPVGAAIDRFGARRVILPLFLCDAVGVTSYGFVHTSWQALGAATIAALGGAAVWTGQNTILTTVTSEEERQHVFGLSFAILNLGIGVGGLTAGFIADIHHPASFQLLYVINGIAVIAPALILLSMRGIGGPIVRREAKLEHSDRAAGRRRPSHGGYREVFANRAFRRYAIFVTVLMSVGYAQIEVGFPAFASAAAGVSPRVIALALTANTATIVIFQLFVLKRMRGRSRSRALALVGAIIGLSWLVLGAGALGKSISPAIPIAGTILCSAVFACGETLMSPIMPALTNALATDELRGRYNAISSMTWGLTAIVGPLTAAPLIGHHHANVWLALVVAGALVASLIALSLRRLLTPQEDGRDVSSAPSTPDASGGDVSSPTAVPAEVGLAAAAVAVKAAGDVVRDGR